MLITNRERRSKPGPPLIGDAVLAEACSLQNRPGAKNALDRLQAQPNR